MGCGLVVQVMSPAAAATVLAAARGSGFDELTSLQVAGDDSAAGLQMANGAGNKGHKAAAANTTSSEVGPWFRLML